MSDQEIVAKLTELGFYGNDTSSTIKPKTEKKKAKIIDDNNSKLIENLKVLKKLFDDGVLTKEEFTKAKKKLIN
jgi:hypothetical protein